MFHKKQLLYVAFFMLCIVSAQNKKKNISEEGLSKKVVFIIVDGIASDMLKGANTLNLDSISNLGTYTEAYVGGKRNTYSETPTISAVGYNSLLTGTWVNKHNVFGNEIVNPNYNYPTIFRIFKDNYPKKSIAIFSTWKNNRTKLIGEDLEQTGKIKIDYAFDGFELDTIRFPHDADRKFIKNIDILVADKASECIKNKAPDLSWVYLEYSDDMGHKYGDSEQLKKAIELEDKLVGKIWKSVVYREKEFNEDWLLIITTDHGRTSIDGKHHGGQSDRERSTWIVMNKKSNDYTQKFTPAIVDIFPSIVDFMKLEMSKDNKFELDGISMLGKVDVRNLEANLSGRKLELSWENLSGNPDEKAKIYISYTNNIKDRGLKDDYTLISEVLLSESKKEIILPKEIDFCKIVLETPHTILNTWIKN